MHVAEYTGYRTLRFERRECVLRVTIDRTGVLFREKRKPKFTGK